MHHNFSLKDGAFAVVCCFYETRSYTQTLSHVIFQMRQHCIKVITAGEAHIDVMSLAQRCPADAEACSQISFNKSLARYHPTVNDEFAYLVNDLAATGLVLNRFEAGKRFHLMKCSP